ncbi:MAG: mechanosensitive ion channel family protein [Casimicrobiaceae bacterium]|nr:mechanosensitive ion channel family protein [Casimicrobiaceae bacterium]
MNSDHVLGFWSQLQPQLIAVGLKVLGAIAAWIVGRWLIGLATRLLSRVLTAQEVDPTLQRYLGNFVTVALNIALVVAILGYFGIETTTFAALVAGAGVAIGAAWSGLLANFAAGMFMLALRPIKVGDYVVAGGVEGTVKEIGLFATTIVTPDNVLTYVGNNKVMGGDIKNFSANDYRRVDLVAQLASGADHARARALLKEAVSKVPNVLAEPAVDVEILEFTEFGPKLAVRPYTHTRHYWQVYFDTNRVIAETLGAAGFPVATRPVRILGETKLV